MARPARKKYLGSFKKVVRLGSLYAPLQRAAAAENLHTSDLIIRECARFLSGQHVKVDTRLLNPPVIQARLLAAAGSSRR